MNLETKKDDVNNIFPDLNAVVNNKPDISKSAGAGNTTPPNFMPKGSRLHDTSNPVIPAAGDNSAETPVPEKSMANVFGDAPVAAKNKISKRSLIIAAAICLLLAAVAGIIIVEGEELGILRPKPEKVLAQMMENMKSVKTSYSEGNGQLIVTNSKAPGQSMNMGFKLIAGEDATDAENPKANLNYDLNLAIEGMSFTANFDITVVDKIAYFRLNKAPLLPFMDMGKFKGKWIKADPKEIEKLNPSAGQSLKTLGSTEEMSVKIKALMEKYQGNLIKVQKELPDETVDGVKSYSYSIALEKTTLQQLFAELKTISEDAIKAQTDDTNKPLQDKLLDAQYKILNEVIGMVSDKADIKIAIGKKDKLMQDISFKISLTGKDLNDIAAKISGSTGFSASSGETEGLALDLNFDIKYSDYNKPVDIKAPENAEDFMKALGIEESLNTAKSKAHDAKRQSDLQQLRTALIFYYDDNNSYPIAKNMEKTSEKNSAIYKLVPKYISEIPVDSLEPNYYYGYKSDGKTYELTARAEEKGSARCTKINENLCLFIVSGK